jgi:hypothetical protein
MDKRYEAMKRPPQDALKTIPMGPLKGKSDINPQWKYEVMTEQFGLCGIGWRFEIVDRQTVPVPTGEVMIFVTVNLYVKDGDDWSAAIPGTGGDFIVKKDKNGIHGDDEGVKKAITDALGNALKMVGVAADIYRGMYNTKYNKYTDSGTQRPYNTQNTANKGNYTSQQKQSVKTGNTPKTVDDYYALTIEWAKEHKAVTLIGPIMEQHFHKKRFQALTFNEAKTFYDNLPKLVKQMQNEDDAALMNGVG